MPDTARAHRAKSESMDEIFSNPSCSLVVSGGYMLGEQLFFTGPNETFANGDKVVHGQKGMVTGSATSKSHKLKGVKVRFPSNKDWVDCYLYQVSRNPPPPLPGGYRVGEKVFCTVASQNFPSGDKVVHGQQGVVMGPATGERCKGTCVAVRFPGNKRNVDCYITSVRRLRPPKRPTRRCLRAHAPRGPSTSLDRPHEPHLQATAASVALEMGHAGYLTHSAFC